MKKGVLCLLILLFIFLCVGCSLDTNKKQITMKTISELREEAENLEDNYVNLNLEDTVISIPEVEEISDLVFPITYNTLEEQKAKFEENIRKYAGLNEDVDLTPYMSIMYLDVETNERLAIPYNEATNEQLDKIQYLSYNDGRYSELLVFSNYMLEMGDYELPTSLIGDNKDYSKNVAGYRGWDLGYVVETYYPLKDDISDVFYTLVDGEVSLKDAIVYAEKHVKEDYYFVGSDFLEYRVYEAQVRQLNDSLYYYQLYLGPVYQGIPLNKDSGLISYTTERDVLSMGVFGDGHKVSMFDDDTLGFIWSSCHSYESVEVQESHSEFISLEDACSILSDYISEKKELDITSIELIYQTEFRYESLKKMQNGYIESIYCHPVYHFLIKNPGVNGVSACYFDVDAITGEIVLAEG